MVNLYEGTEINTKEIQKLKDIAFQRYPIKIFNDYFENVNDIEDLAKLHNVNINTERLVLGNDWFLCYSETERYIKILEWVSLDSGNKMLQLSEMIHVLKKLFIKNKNKLFIADMRHDTSYKVYLKMLQNGYFKEIYHEYVVDCAAPQHFKYNNMEKYNTIEEFLASKDAKIKTEYLKYILHYLNFEITDKFIKKYDHTLQKSKRILKK